MEVADRGIPAFFHGSGRRMVFAHEKLKQGGFSRSIIADQADAVIGMDVPGSISHYIPCTKIEGDVL